MSRNSLQRLREVEVKHRSLSEVLSRLREKSQKNLVLGTAFFLLKVQKVNRFSSDDIKRDLSGLITGASKINVGAVLLNQCIGLAEPLRERSENGLKLWRLTPTGDKYISELFVPTNRANTQKNDEDFCLSLEDLHPVIQDASVKLFQDGYLSGAVEAAFKALNRHIRKKTGRTSDGGVAMMHRIFSPAEFKNIKDCLRLNSQLTQSDKDEQEGYRFLYAGAQQGIRNPFDHDGRSVKSQIDAFEYLAFASHLTRIADRAELV